MTINICSVVKIKMWIPHLLWCLREAHCLQGWWNRVCRLCSCTPTFWLLPLVIYLISFKTWVQKAPFASTLMTRLATLLILDGFSCFSQKCSATGMGQFPMYKLKWDLLRTSVTACTIDKNTFFAPFEIFYVRTEIWKEFFQKKSYTTP